MATHCFIPMLGKRMRVTQMSTGGAVGTSFISTEGFISVNLTSEVEDGAEIVQRNAAGNLCVNERQASSFKRFNVEAEFCNVNPSLLSFVTNAKTYADYAGDIAGFTVPEGALTGAFSLELWTGLSGALGDQNASGYFLLPLVQKGVLGDITIDGENAVTFSLSGSYTLGGNKWGTGPYKVLMNASQATAKLPTAIDPLDHLLVIDTSVAVPPQACSPALVSSAA